MVVPVDIRIGPFSKSLVERAVTVTSHARGRLGMSDQSDLYCDRRVLQDGLLILLDNGGYEKSWCTAAGPDPQNLRNILKVASQGVLASLIIDAPRGTLPLPIRRILQDCI